MVCPELGDEVVELSVADAVKTVLLRPHPLSVTVDVLVEDGSGAPRVFVFKDGEEIADVSEDDFDGGLVAEALADAVGEEIGVLTHGADECDCDL